MIEKKLEVYYTLNINKTLSNFKTQCHKKYDMLFYKLSNCLCIKIRNIFNMYINNYINRII